MRLSDIFKTKRTEEERSAPEPISDPRAMEAFMGYIAGSGNALTVNKSTCTSIVAVLACLRVRVETFASLPCHVYVANGDERSVARGDPIDSILSRSPNGFMTPYDFWSWKQYSEDVHGNAYALKVKTSTGRVTALHPLDSSAMQVVNSGMRLVYRYSGDRDVPAQEFLPMDIVHFRGTIPDGPYKGASLVDATTKTLGLGAEAEQFFHNLLKNGTHFPNYFEADKDVTERGIKDLREQLDGFSGLFEAGRTRVFPSGIHLKQNEMSLRDMDFAPQLRWNLEQVSRIWRVPLPLVNDLTHGTYTNSEQAAQWLEQYTISPICASTEQRINASLIGGDGSRYLKFNMDSLRRGDYKTRTEGYQRMVNMGAMTRNEVRAKEDMNPLEGLDKPIISLANGTIDPTGETQNPNMIIPVVDNAAEQIRTRYARDGDTERTWKYMRMVAAPVVETLENLGVQIDTDDFIKVMISNGT